MLHAWHPRPRPRPRESLPLCHEERELANLAKALGHPARLRIPKISVKRYACICGDIEAGKVGACCAPTLLRLASSPTDSSVP